MGANSNPIGTQEGSNGGPSPLQAGGAAAAAAGPSNGSTSTAGAANLATSQALKHDPGLSVEWSAEEVAILEEGLNLYSSESAVVRFAKIAMKLQAKTVRDVALRCRWMNHSAIIWLNMHPRSGTPLPRIIKAGQVHFKLDQKKEVGKRRKEDHNLPKKSKDKKERATDPSAKPSGHQTGRPNAPPYSLPMPPLDNDDDISIEAIGGLTGQLLQNNLKLFHQISSNQSNSQMIHENISIFCQVRANICKILNDSNDMPGVMNQMPPLPVKINEELANSILPPMMPSMPMQTSN